MTGKVSAWWGLGALGAITAAGAAIGAVTNTPCNPGSTTAPALCGPTNGALYGTGIGLTIGGIAGLGAALSPRYRTAGLTAAGVVGALIVWNKIKASAPAPQVTP
jgi:hypothetical protein